jgi:uncharacterized protein (TIGR02599 family)
MWFDERFAQQQRERVGSVGPGRADALTPMVGKTLSVRAFTLLELLVSTALLIILVGITVGIISATQGVWRRASAQVEQFRAARQEFGSVASRIAQATLNPYWTVTQDAQGQPVRYERASELRFRLGTASALVPGAAEGGSAVFFQSPTGFFSDGSGDLGAALNAWGYFVEYGSDKSYRPAFLAAAGVPERYRFRLIEFLDPSDKLTLFTYTSGSSSYAGSEWFSSPLGIAGRKRILAENMIALVALPKPSSLEDPTGYALAPDMNYDSTTRLPNPALNPRNQLPPVLEIAAVVVSERSAERMTWGNSPPDLGSDFSPLFRQAELMDSDLATLRDAPLAKGLDARIFRQSVPLPAARWSTEQTN